MMCKILLHNNRQRKAGLDIYVGSESILND